KERARARRKMASRSAVLPAPLGPMMWLRPAPGSRDTWARFRNWLTEIRLIRMRTAGRGAFPAACGLKRTEGTAGPKAAGGFRRHDHHSRMGMTTYLQSDVAGSGRMRALVLGSVMVIRTFSVRRMPRASRR